MLIAQVSDLHMTPPDKLAQGKVETLPRLEQVIADLNTRQPRPDVVLFTGDLADHKHPVSYDVLIGALGKLEIPYFVIPGNHDDRDGIRRVLPHHPSCEGKGFIQYVLEDFPVRLIGLDTLDDDDDKGLLCTERLAWLDEALSQKPDTPTLLFMHHPPFDTGIHEMDYYSLVGRENLSEIVQRHKQIERIICGHIHRVILTVWAGVLTSIAPSPSFTQVLGLAEDGAMGFLVESPKYDLHCWTGGGFVSHMVTIEDNSGPYPYPLPSEL